MIHFQFIQLKEYGARTILRAEANCYSEGLEGIDPALLLRIADKWPKLVEEYDWLPWEHYHRVAE